jgi:hypothetical protein
MRRTRGFAILYLVALAAPVAAADYTLWQRPGIDGSAIDFVKSKKGGGDSCCKHCTKGQPCGNSCISLKDRCHQPPGCAC